MDSVLAALNDLPTSIRLILFAGVAVAIHLVVVLIRHAAAWAMASGSARQFAKLRTIATIATSAIVFSLYFFAVGLILREFGVSLTAYLASASVLGLAIGFGSQGIVQDVVTGLTLIFSDLLDVGDLVEVSGQTGIVRGITMRFIELQNSMGAQVFIPNRTINNVVSYPRGYMRCIVDVTLRGDEQARQATEDTATALTLAAHEQFAGILITQPSVEGRMRFTSGKEILRVKFRLWPGRGQPIETVFVQELTALLKQTDPDYQSWMIAVTYEVEKPSPIPSSPFRWPWQRQR
jgi:small conductance mechanosensitive channel